MNGEGEWEYEEIPLERVSIGKVKHIILYVAKKMLGGGKNEPFSL